MADSEAFLAIIIQWGVLIVTFLIVRKQPHSVSMYYGAILTFSLLLYKDALPWISIWKTEFTFQPKWHHSKYGAICLILALLYKGAIAICYDKWAFVRFMHHIFEERVWTIGPFKFVLFYLALSIAILALETQLHEIIYFKTFRFQDRGFPLDIQLKLG